MKNKYHKQISEVGNVGAICVEGIHVEQQIILLFLLWSLHWNKIKQITSNKDSAHSMVTSKAISYEKCYYWTLYDPKATKNSSDSTRLWGWSYHCQSKQNVQQIRWTGFL